MISQTSLSDWDRFSYYARRVRQFGLRHHAPPRFGWGFGWKALDNSPEILSDIRAAHPAGKIFPGLLELFISNRDIFVALDSFVSDSLKMLSINAVRLDPYRVSPSFGQLRSSCRALESFNLSNCILSAEEAGEFSKMVCGSTALITVSWYKTTPICPADVLVHLSSPPNLKIITADVPTWSPEPATKSSHRVFSSLQNFSAVVPNLDDFMHHLASVTSTQLSFIIGSIHVKPTAATQVKRALTAMGSRVVAAPTAQLALLSEQPSADPHSQNDDVPFPPETIHPLLALCNLTRLHIALLRPIAVDDELLKTMAASWPRLQVLKLVHPKGVAAAPQLTLRGLIPLANCPELVRCALIVNAKTLPEDAFERPPGRHASRVWLIDVAHSPVTERFRVAAFLSDLFPELRRVEYTRYDAWHDVEKTLQTYSAVRKQERRYPA
ncbi:hypothetical protein B0H14DRAFT_2625375 [Mycena olivaceomarginata]|nr:hypothetical protein B0H14DRAFT_2625375 [Mycena olivaceomarginata]